MCILFQMNSTYATNIYIVTNLNYNLPICHND